MKKIVRIENIVQIGSHCSIYSVSTIDGKTGPVALKNGCRVGSHSVVMPGVTIEGNAIVGAFSFVNEDIPDNQQQIARGGPITITHPEITRYFMSIPEAAQLILQAAVMGQGGEIYILKMGNPVRIVDLANEVIRLNGLETGKDIEIVFTGLRPGEKLYEELITEGEGIVPTSHEKIMVLKGNNHRDYEYVTAQIDELTRISDTFDIDAIKKKLKEIVPEYTPQP